MKLQKRVDGPVVGERAEERIEALIDLNAEDGLWDVASMLDYADLLDQLPMPETDEEDRMGVTQQRFRDAMVNQVSKWRKLMIRIVFLWKSTRICLMR